MTIRVEHHHYHHLAGDEGKDSSLADILAGILKLEKRIMKTDDQIAAFKSDVDAKLAGIQTSLGTMASAQTDIAADEKNILDQLKNMPADGLSPESQAILAGVVASLGTVADSSKAQADSLQSLADSIPNTAPTA